MKTSIQRALLAITLFIPFLASAQTVEEITDVFWNQSSCRELTQERRIAMTKMQSHADTFTHKQFNEYLSAPLGSEKERIIGQTELRSATGFSLGAPRFAHIGAFVNLNLPIFICGVGICFAFIGV